MTPRVARIVSVTVLVVAAGAIAGSAAIWTTADEVPKGMIVVVGDRSAEGLADVLTELQQRRAAGDPLSESSGGVGLGILASSSSASYGPPSACWSSGASHGTGRGVLPDPGTPFPLLTLAQALVVYGLKAGRAASRSWGSGRPSASTPSTRSR